MIYLLSIYLFICLLIHLLNLSILARNESGSGASFQIFFFFFFFFGGGAQRRLGERSEPNQQGDSGGGGCCKPPSKSFFDFELFYVLFEAI